MRTSATEIVIDTLTSWPITLPSATETSAGLMSAADKVKLDSLDPSGGLPDQTGHAEQFLTTNGTVAAWSILTGTLATSSLPTSVWSWPLNLTGTLFRYQPNDGLGVDWRMNVSANPNASGPRNDNVWTMGWNAGPNGPVNTLKGHLQINMEDYYWNGFDFQSEFYIAAGPPAAVGGATRFIAINTSQTDADRTELLLNAHVIQLGAGAGPSAGQVQLDVSDAEIVLASPDAGQDTLIGVSTGLIRFSGPSNNSSGDQTLQMYDAAVQYPGVMARFGGGVVPQSDGTRDLGWYTDSASFRLRWKRVVGKRGQFIDQELIEPAYNDVGSITTLWDAAEATFSALWALQGTPTTLRWERLVTSQDLALKASTSTVASATSLTLANPITRVTGTTTVQTLVVPQSFTDVTGGIRFIVAVGALPFGTDGNIGTAFTATPGTLYIFAWDGVSKWWPTA